MTVSGRGTRRSVLLLRLRSGLVLPSRQPSGGSGSLCPFDELMAGFDPRAEAIHEAQAKVVLYE